MAFKTVCVCVGGGGLSVLDLSPMYETDVRRCQTSDRQMSDAHHRLMPTPRHNNRPASTFSNSDGIIFYREQVAGDAFPSQYSAL